MSEASFASLGPTLLARKGGAKPAMRPQLAPLPELVADEQLEDLGWNDMGQDDDASAAANNNIVAIKPSALAQATLDMPGDMASDMASDAEDEADSPLLQCPKRKAKSPAKAKRNSVRKATADTARRAAFTLRLDTDRHLKLRLAATMQGMSAQALVTEALDALLADIEELDDLAQKMGGHMGSRLKPS